MAHQLAGSRYVAITTFRRDGTAVSNPMWIAEDGERLVMVTDADSAKVRRLSADPRMRLTVSDARGRIEDGAIVFEARAELLDEAGTRRAGDAIAAKYGFQARAVAVLNHLRSLVGRRAQRRQGIAVHLDT